MGVQINGVESTNPAETACGQGPGVRGLAGVFLDVFIRARARADRLTSRGADLPDTGHFGSLTRHVARWTDATSSGFAFGWTVPTYSLISGYTRPLRIAQLMFCGKVPVAS